MNEHVTSGKKKLVMQFTKRNLIAIGIILIFCIACAGYVYEVSVKKELQTDSPVKLQYAGDTDIGLLNPGFSIIQKFTYSGVIKGVQLPFGFGTYKKTNDHGSVTLSITDASTGKTLAKTSVPLNQIKDNQAVDFEFGKSINCEKKHDYNIVIESGSDFDSNCLLTVYYGAFRNDNTLNEQFSNLTYNSQKLDGVLAFSVLQNNYFLLWPLGLFACAITVLMLAGYYFICIAKAKIEVIFLFLAISLGLLYLFILPPISAPDEDTHFATTYEYSNRLLGHRINMKTAVIQKKAMTPTYVNGEQHLHSHYRIPARMTDVKAYESLLKYPGLNQYRAIPRGLLEYAGDWNQFAGQIQECVIPVSPAIYLPGIAGITIARLLGLGGFQLIYLGRLANLLFYIFLAYLGIRRMPFGKLTLAAVGLLPMTLHIAASYSYDATMNGIAILFIGHIFYLAYGERRIGWRDIALLFACTFIFGCTKGVYSALLLMIFILPAKKVHSIKVLWTLAASLGVFSIVTFLFFNLNTLGSYAAALNARSTYTFQYVFQHPQWFLFMCVKTAIHYSSYYLATMIGGALGWLEISIQWIIVFAFMLILLCTILRSAENQYVVNVKTRVLAFSVFPSLLFMLFFVAITWNTMPVMYIGGVQGRYLLPALPLLLYSIQRKSPAIVLKKSIDRLLLMSIVSLHILTLATVFETIIGR